MTRYRSTLRKIGWTALLAAGASLHGGGCQLMVHDAVVGAAETTFLTLLDPCNFQIAMLSANCPAESADQAGG